MPHQLKSHPRKYGKDARCCRVCTATQGLIRKYELMICRRCFREQAAQIGFQKLRWTQCDLYTKVTNADATIRTWEEVSVDLRTRGSEEKGNGLCLCPTTRDETLPPPLQYRNATWRAAPWPTPPLPDGFVRYVIAQLEPVQSTKTSLL